MAGLVGAGRSEIAQIICGARKRNFLGGGLIYLHGRPIRYRTPRQAIEEGIVYITEDRKSDGFFEMMTSNENIYLGYLVVPQFARFLYSRRQQKRVADHGIASTAVSALKRTLRIAEYSGGNQQKVVVAKSLVQRPGLVIFARSLTSTSRFAILRRRERLS